MASQRMPTVHTQTMVGMVMHAGFLTMLGLRQENCKLMASLGNVSSVKGLSYIYFIVKTSSSVSSTTERHIPPV